MISIEFKKFGVNLTFLPTVLTDGRINMKVYPGSQLVGGDQTRELVAMRQGGVALAVYGGMAVHFEFQDAAGNADRAWHMASGVFGRLAHVDHDGSFKVVLLGAELFGAGYGLSY